MRVLLSTHAFAAIFAVGERSASVTGGTSFEPRANQSYLPTTVDGVLVPRLFQSTAPESLNHDSPTPQAPHLSQPKPPSRTLVPSREDET